MHHTSCKDDHTPTIVYICNLYDALCLVYPAVTPPGYFTVNGATSACPNGSFRADWKPAAQAASCTPCGEGVQGLKTDRLVIYLDNGTTVEVPVMSSADDCCEWLTGFGWKAVVVSSGIASAEQCL
jgi:hypothetical protein